MEGKRALVTGGAKRLGAAIARRLHAAGASVLIHYRDSEAEAAKLEAELNALRPKSAAKVKAELLAPIAPRALVSAALDAFGGLDVLVNNAGVMTLKAIAETDDATFERMMNVNLKGTFNTLREAATRVREGGRIINLSSTVVGLLQPTYGVYAATKAAVEALTSVFAKELRGRNVRVNAVAPGSTDTELFRAGRSQEVIDRMTKMPPLERLGQPADIAAAVAFLAGPDGAFINGQTLRVNGGMI